MSSVREITEMLNTYSDLQRQSRFKVFFSSKIPNFALDKIRDLSLTCEAVDIPGRVFNTFDYRTYGPVVKFPTQSFFGEVTCTFFCKGNLKYSNYTGLPEKRIFEDWMNYINPYPSSRGNKPDIPYHNFKYKDNYSADMQIVCYGVDHKPSYQIDLINSFPTTVSPVSMTWTSEEVARVAVTFSYDYFVYKNQTDGYPEGSEIAISTAQSSRATNLGRER